MYQKPELRISVSFNVRCFEGTVIFFLVSAQKTDKRIRFQFEKLWTNQRRAYRCTLFIFYKHAVYKHTRLQIAHILSNLLIVISICVFINYNYFITGLMLSKNHAYKNVEAQISENLRTT